MFELAAVITKLHSKIDKLRTERNKWRRKYKRLKKHHDYMYKDWQRELLQAKLELGEEMLKNKNSVRLLPHIPKKKKRWFFG